jgi:ABC-type antimicrobial peptide transport system permease subunit
MIRTRGEVAGLMASVRAVGAEVDSLLPLYDAKTLVSQQAENLEQDRLGALVTALFAGAGLLLAALGLYGVLSFAVNADRREIGVRLALGASRAHVLRLVVMRALRLTTIGLVLGVAGSWAAGRAIAAFVEGATPDPRIVAMAAMALTLTAAAAMLIPAARATRIDPLRALRDE